MADKPKVGSLSFLAALLTRLPAESAGSCTTLSLLCRQRQQSRSDPCNYGNSRLVSQAPNRPIALDFLLTSFMIRWEELSPEELEVRGATQPHDSASGPRLLCFIVMHRTVLMCCATLAAHPYAYSTAPPLMCYAYSTAPPLMCYACSTPPPFNVLRLQHTPYNFKWKQLNYRKAELESLGTVKVASLARRRLVP